jgi:hypothetical protein
MIDTTAFLLLLLSVKFESDRVFLENFPRITLTSVG